MDNIVIKYTDDASAPEKTREEVRPGAPFISFTIAPNVPVVFINPIESSGLFQINTVISEGDTVKSVKDKLAKVVGVKGKQFHLMFFEIDFHNVNCISDYLIHH